MKLGPTTAELRRRRERRFTIAAWSVFALASPFMVYVLWFQMAHYADMAPWTQLQATWQYCLAYMTLALIGMGLLYMADPKRRRGAW